MRPASEGARSIAGRSEEHTSELQSHLNLVCRLLLEKRIRGPHRHRPHLQWPREDRRPRLRMQAGRPGRRGNGHQALLFLKDAATTDIYTLSLHDVLPI